MDADIGMLNSGSIRSDRVHRRGALCGKDISDILPYNDAAVVLMITGKQLHEALENSVSQYPALEGRFSQVSGIKFSFDPRKPPGSRVDPAHVYCKNAEGRREPVNMSKEYKCVLKSFIAEGKDGFDCFAQRENTIIARSTEEQSISTLVRNYFHTIAQKPQNGTLQRRFSLRKLQKGAIKEMLEDGNFEHLEPNCKSTVAHVRAIHPCVEGRIVCLYPDEDLVDMMKGDQ